MYSKKIALISTLALLLSSAGCATNSSVRKVESEAIAARQTADSALLIAREAKQIAIEAGERSVTTQEIVNRSFKKSMYK